MPKGREEVFFKEIHQFYIFNPPPPPPFGEWGHEIYNFLSPYPSNATKEI